MELNVIAVVGAQMAINSSTASHRNINAIDYERDFTYRTTVAVHLLHGIINYFK